MSTVQYCFTSTETIRLVRPESPGDGHLDSHTAPELCFRVLSFLFTRGGVCGGVGGGGRSAVGVGGMQR